MSSFIYVIVLLLTELSLIICRGGRHARAGRRRKRVRGGTGVRRRAALGVHSGSARAAQPRRLRSQRGATPSPTRLPTRRRHQLPFRHLVSTKRATLYLRVEQ